MPFIGPSRPPPEAAKEVVTQEIDLDLKAMKESAHETKAARDFEAKLKDKSVYRNELLKFDSLARVLASTFRTTEKDLIGKAGATYRNDNDSATPSMPAQSGDSLPDFETNADDARATIERIALLIPELSDEDRLKTNALITNARVTLAFLSTKIAEFRKEADAAKRAADHREELSERARQNYDPTRYARYREVYTKYVGAQVGLEQDAAIRRHQIAQAKFRRRWARMAPNTNVLLPGETEWEWHDRKGKWLNLPEPKQPRAEAEAETKAARAAMAEAKAERAAARARGDEDVRSESHGTRGTSVLGTESLNEVIRDAGDYPLCDFSSENGWDDFKMPHGVGDYGVGIAQEKAAE